MAPKYKLTFFNVHQSGLIRFIFHYANQEFEDNRVTIDQWSNLKPKIEFGKLPILEIDGKEVNQTKAISRYLAKQFGLAGNDEQEALQVDALVDTFGDYKSLLVRRMHEENEERIAESKKNETVYLEKFEKIVSGNPSGLLIGSQVTWADLLFACGLPEVEKRKLDSLKPYPGLVKLVEKINTSPSIKAYLEKRPTPEVQARNCTF